MDTNVLLFGCTKGDSDIIEKLLPHSDIAVVNANDFAGFVSVNCRVAIINTQYINDDDLRALHDYYVCVNDPSETVILINNPDAAACEMCDKAFIRVRALDNAGKRTIKHILKNAFKERIFLKTMSDIKILSDSLMILRVIKLNPGISTSGIASKTNLDNRSINGYISKLVMSGEPVIYNTSLKGWELCTVLRKPNGNE